MNYEQAMYDNAIDLDVHTFYGNLKITKVEGNYFWGVDSHSDVEWKPINLKLYKALLEEAPLADTWQNRRYKQ